MMDLQSLMPDNSAGNLLSRFETPVVAMEIDNRDEASARDRVRGLVDWGVVDQSIVGPSDTAWLDMSMADFQLQELAEKWRADNQFVSSISEMISHPAYLRIIAFGEEALPFLLRALEREPDFWFWALSAITGEDPTSVADNGDIEAMSRAWLEWGRDKAYI